MNFILFLKITNPINEFNAFVLLNLKFIFQLKNLKKIQFCVKKRLERYLKWVLIYYFLRLIRSNLNYVIF